MRSPPPKRGESPVSIVVAEFTISSDVFVLGQVLRNHEDVRVDLTQFVPLGDALVPYFWAETDDMPAFEELVRSDDRVASLTRLNGCHGRHLYSIEWATDIGGFIAAVTEHDLIVVGKRSHGKRVGALHATILFTSSRQISLVRHDC